MKIIAPILGSVKPTSDFGRWLKTIARFFFFIYNSLGLDSSELLESGKFSY